MIEITNILDAEKYLEQIEAVIFDLDDTLYSEKAYVRSGFQQIALHFEKQEMFPELWAAFKRGEKAVDVVLEKYHLTERKSEALSVYRFQKPDIRLYPGVAEMLSRIQQTRKLGIITDGRPEGQRAKLLALGVAADKIIVTDELGGVAYRKPNPTAFQKMQEWMQLEYGHMVYIGDNIAKDFIAPEGLGMKSIWFRNKDGLYVK